MSEDPVVFVTTPVYNGEPFLAECIESVIRQTYPNWQYVIVDNCSTDATLEIAMHYASLDPRIRVHKNRSFVGSIDNHNIAVKLITPESKYCKVVSADDWLFPECLARMVELAEVHPSVAIVGSYQLSGCGEEWRVRWDEIRYPCAVIPGREICRSHLLGGPYIFGTPTSSLYRADVVRARTLFYPHSMPHADTSVCYECLADNDYGFVHQVLSFERIHEESVSAGCRKLRTSESILLRNLLSYGPVYLTKEEYDEQLRRILDKYYDALAAGLLHAQGRSFWHYHRDELSALGFRCFGMRLAAAVINRVLDLALNPKSAFEKILKQGRNSHPSQRERGESSLERANGRTEAKASSAARQRSKTLIES